MHGVRLYLVPLLVLVFPISSQEDGTDAAAGSKPPAAQVRLHYGIIFDAGSSGSRIHVYTWRSGGTSGDFELVEDDLLKVKPGLSSFNKDPSKAGSSLGPLLSHAKAKIPAEQHSVTPVFLMATAGLRMVGDSVAEEILQSVSDTFLASPFLFRQGWAYIMPGMDEGLFGWVAVNYLLGALHDVAVPTTGVIDLGGGSVQLVFTAPVRSSLPSDSAASFSFAGQDHKLYVKSHLGFGLDRARDRVAERLALHSGAGGAATEHPCVPRDHRVTLKAGKEKHLFVGTGSHEGCTVLYKELFDKAADCPVAPCSFNGAHQPELPSAIFGFSYLFDRTRAIGLLDGQVEMFGTQAMTLHDIHEASAQLCSSEPGLVQERFASCEDAEKWANFCGDAVYMTVLLEHGFGISRAAPLTMGNKVAGVELVWTLGAMIAKAAELPRILMEESARVTEL